MARLLKSLLLLAFLSCGAGAHSAEEPALLTRLVPDRGLDEITERLRDAITASNYTFVRQQVIDSRMVPVDWEAKSVRIVHFCNFSKMDAALRRDLRTAQLLPCRITLVEGDHGVDLVAANPVWITGQWNAPGLQPHCQQLKQVYLAILEEASL